MAAKQQKESGETSSSDEDEDKPTEKFYGSRTPPLKMLKGTQAKEEIEEERTGPLVNNENEAAGLDNNQEEDPLPGFTTSGQRIQQCSDPGGQHSPIVGVACPLQYEGAILQEQDGLEDVVVFIFIIIYLFRM
ncbi:uncharacterized protein LOC144631466 isoform X1 [Oculina patagonica]